MTVDKFKEHFSSGEKDVTSLSHPNRKVDEKNMTNTDFIELGIGKRSYNYPEISDKYNSKSTGKQEKERENEPRLPGTPDCKGMVTSRINDVTIREQDGELSINKLVARQYERTRDRLCSVTEKGYREVVKTYNKIITVMTFYCILVTQVLKGITSPRRYERKSTTGNSKSFSGSKSVRDYGGYTFYTVLECLGEVLGSKHRLWLSLIIHGLWRKYEVIRNKNKEIWKFLDTLTFRLVVARPWLRNLLLGNVLETFSVLVGSTEDTSLAGKDFRAYLFPYSDLWASRRIYLYIYTVILEFYDKFGRFCKYIYLYMYNSCHLRLSCKWASYPLAFAVKSYTLVYFSSKASLLMIKSHKKYQSIDLIGLALAEKAYIKNR